MDGRMQIASVMAEDAEPLEPGAPIPKDRPDEDLIKLKRPRPKIGVPSGVIGRRQAQHDGLS